MDSCIKEGTEQSKQIGRIFSDQCLSSHHSGTRFQWTASFDGAYIVMLLEKGQIMVFSHTAIQVCVRLCFLWGV